MKRSQTVATTLALALVLIAFYLPKLSGTPTIVVNPVIAGNTQAPSSGTDNTTDGSDTNQSPSSPQSTNPTPSPDDQTTTTGPGSTNDNQGGTQTDGGQTGSLPQEELVEISDGIFDARARQAAAEQSLSIEEDGWYTSKEEVAFYIHTYGHLPDNFISKTKARRKGWVSTEGNLDEVCPGMSIGGSVFYNEGWEDEALLPEERGRTWTECDINYHGGYRGPERIVFSNDGLIFYTADHYLTYEQLY